MTSQELKKFNLPDKPGIYFFKAGGKILYVGKATSLKDRVRSYFSSDLEAARGLSIVQMVELADDLAFIETDSVLEALILEAAQIKKHRPKYNIRERDDKSFNFVVITKEDFPRLLVVRGKQLRDDEALAEQVKYQFGPFPYGLELREAIKIIRRIIPFRDKCVPAPEMFAKGKKPVPCFDSQIGLCPGTCGGKIGQEEYKETVKNLRLLFQGRKKDVLRSFEKQMKQAAARQEFEAAAEFRRKIFALSHIQDVSLIKYRGEPLRTGTFRIEAYDIAHLGGSNTVGVMTVVLDGELDKNSYRKFTIRGAGKEAANDTENLREILARRFNHDEWQLPDLLVLDGGKAQLNAAQKILTALGLNIPLCSVVKDEFHRAREIIDSAGPYGHSRGNRRSGSFDSNNTDLKKIIREHERDIILANSEAHRYAIHFHRQRRRRVI